MVSGKHLQLYYQLFLCLFVLFFYVSLGLLLSLLLLFVWEAIVFFFTFRCFLLQKFQALLVGALREKLVTDTLTGLAKTLTPVKSLIGRLLFVFDYCFCPSLWNLPHCFFFCFVVLSLFQWSLWRILTLICLSFSITGRSNFFLRFWKVWLKMLVSHLGTSECKRPCFIEMKNNTCRKRARQSAVPPEPYPPRHGCRIVRWLYSVFIPERHFVSRFFPSLFVER